MTPPSAHPGRGSSCQAGFASSGVLWAATLALPRGVSRDRYRREFAAELYGRPRARQLAYVLGVSVHMWPLRTVLVHGSDSLHLPFLCRAGLHHRWNKDVNDQGLPFHTCSRCGREREGPLVNSLFRPVHVGGMNH